MKQLLSAILFALVSFEAVCQEHYYYSFSYNDSIEVFDSIGKRLDFAWTGGLNFCQFSNIDLDGDGIQDLFVFDRSGNRILTFLKQEDKYVFSPEYINFFPPLKYIALLRDYNGDGYPDIFSYGYTGISVYKNLMKETGKLEFQLMSNQLLSDYYGMLLNLYVTYVDIPAIVDIDNDGDLDILSFAVLADKIHLHRNMSMEKYGVPDSLEYVLENDFWGNICESEDNNKIYFGSECNLKATNDNNQALHVGSSLLVYDFNGDGKKDVIIGDMDYSNVVLLHNETDNINAKMSKYTDNKFPSYDIPVNIYSNPGCYMLKIDNDTMLDLVVAASDGARMRNSNEIFYYKNIGNNQQPHFQLQTKQFLLENTIDLGEGAYPFGYDIDGDGLIDLIISNAGRHRESFLDSNYILNSIFYSSISFYKNIGTTEKASFKLIDNDLGNISEMGFIYAYPSFADINNDGKIEMIVGDEKGNISLFVNIATKNNPVYQLAERRWSKLSDLYKYSSKDTIALYRNLAPAFCDFDNNGIIDIIVGNKNGTLLYFKNKGSKSNPQFTLQSIKFGNISTVNTDYSYFGYSTPCVVKEGNQHKIYLGSYSGNINAFNIINDINDGNVSIDTFFINTPINGYQTSLALNDWDKDGFLDMIFGNYAGGIIYLKGKRNIRQNIQQKHNADLSKIQLNIYPNPAKDEVFVETDCHYSLNYIIVNHLGKAVKQGTVNKQTNRINTNEISKGIYFLQFYLSEHKGYIVKKLVII